MESPWICEIQKLVNEVFGGISSYIFFYLTAGEVVSILALHGVFLLMQSHNLEYPGLYTKTPFTTGSFVKYSSRFFLPFELVYYINVILFCFLFVRDF